jgi:hypothetical protein
MRKAYQIFAFLIAAEVVVQAAVMVYAVAAAFQWVEDGKGELTKQLLDEDHPDFPGIGGFMLHGMNGMMLIPLITIVFVILSFFSKIPGAPKRAGIIFVLVAVQIVLGLAGHSAPILAALHPINGFALFALAAMTGVAAGRTAPVSTAPAADPVTA